MHPNEKRASAQIIQFPLNKRFEARRPEIDPVLDARIAAALDPAWYHLEAIGEPTVAVPPRH